MKYFSNLPIISYANSYARNILTRVKFVEEFKDISQAYYPFVQQEGSGSLRYEDLSYDYYDDAEDVWIIHLFNEVIDPYYDCTLSQADFDNFITKKYGSLRNAYQTILFYRNNYDQDDSILTEIGYNALSSDVKRYWTPTVNFDNKIIGYERERTDWSVSTNRILSLNVTLQSDTVFKENEKVNQDDASGFVTFSNTSLLTIQHISGSFSNTSNVVGEESGANAEVQTVTVVYNAFDNVSFPKSMSPNEEVYYSPVTAYDYENELNEQKKQISLLDKSYVGKVHSSFRDLTQS